MLPARDRALRLRSLWQCWFLALLFHTDLGLMPLFHGLPVEIASHLDPAAVVVVFRVMLAYVLVPLGSILLITYADTDLEPDRRWCWWRRCHLWLSLMYTFANASHLLVDLLIPDARADQVVLMAVMLAIGVLINREALFWCRDRRLFANLPLPV